MRHPVLSSPLHTHVVTPDFDGFVGQSTPMRHLYAMLRAAACAPCPVLLDGESGTGKTLAAHSLHSRSPRGAKPFVVLDCATIPAAAPEFLLFGHAGQADGIIAQADGGTLFLDDITALPVTLQAKLLQVCDTGLYRRCGDATSRRADLRIIAAATQDVHQHTGLREDLFHRLAALHIVLPPLRQRGGADILRLSHFLLARAVEKSGRQPPALDHAAQDWLCAQDWRGNVRALANCLRHAVVFFPDEHVLAPYHLRPPAPQAQP